MTLSEIDSPHCQDGHVACPNMEFLASVGDIVIDGKESISYKILFKREPTINVPISCHLLG